MLPTTPTPSRPLLRAMDLKALSAFVQKAGQSPFRAKQILQWVYEKGVEDFDSMSNLPKELRAFLRENSSLGGMALVESLGEPNCTQKMVFRADDGQFVESVLMRDDENMSEDEDEEEEAPKGSTPPKRRLSLCVSSQVGCALGCAFCVTGLGGFRRNLRVDEIIDQALTARRLVDDKEERLANLVFMGMGEPLLNLPAVLPALRLLTLPQGLRIATRRVTVSTAGVVPGIEELGQAGIGVNLAVSLNAATQEVRDRLMPGCRKWPIPDLLNACRRFPLSRRQRITFEYVLLRGQNDADRDAERLGRLVRGIPCKINLILYNPDDALEFTPSGESRAAAFRQVLLKANLTVSLRRSKGARHQAACGQLAAHFRPPPRRSVGKMRPENSLETSCA